MKSDFFSEAYQDKLGIPGNRVRVQTSKTISLFAQRKEDSFPKKNEFDVEI